MTKMAAARVLDVQPTEQPKKKGQTISLENIIEQCVQTKASWGLKQNDIAFALTFWSMVECGFRSVPRGDSKKLTEKSHGNLPKNWKHENRPMYEVHFFLPPYADYLVKLVAFPAGDILCINVLSSNVSPKNISLKSLAIYTPGYISRPEDDSVTYKFSRLNDFQLLLKNLIIWPIRCSILTDQGILNGSLCGLSDEIKLKIARHLNVPELLMLSQTCHDLNRICNDQSLWKDFFHLNYKHLCRCATATEECEEECDWKERFKNMYVQKMRKDDRKESPAGSYHVSPEGTYENEIDYEFD